VSATRDRLAARLDAQQRIVEALAESRTLAEAGGRTLEALGTLLGWPLGVLWELDEHHGLMRPVTAWASPAIDAQEFLDATHAVTFTRGVGLVGRAWDGEVIEWVDDLGRDPRFARARKALEAGLRAGIAAPVRGDTGVVGVVELFSPAPRGHDAETAEVLDSVASQVGLYVERWRADVRVEESRELHAATVAASLDCIITMDADGRVVDFNPAAEATFGYTRDEAMGAELADLIIPPELREAHRRAVVRYTETRAARILGRRLELTGMRRDGSRLPVELTVVRIAEREPPLFTGFVRDISERKRVEAEVERLLEAEHDARLAAETAERESARIAATLRRSLLPPRLPEVPGLELSALFQAAGDSEVGGDFYDMFRTGGGRWAAVIGDVMGKGARAAAITALARYTVRAAAQADEDPIAVLGTLNRALLEHEADTQVTLAYTLLAPGPDGVGVEATCGGHPPPLLLRADGRLEELPAMGTLLGAVPDPVLHPARATLAPGDTLLLYTDGVTDMRTPEGLFGSERLAEALRAAAGLPPEELMARLRASTVDAPGHVVRDDVAILLLRASS
jgi:sigma-B regulation protein RsbU (phosphoserine phosphatase)